MESLPNFFAACRFIDQGSVRREDEKGVKHWMAALVLGCCSLLAEQVLAGGDGPDCSRRCCRLALTPRFAWPAAMTPCT